MDNMSGGPLPEARAELGAGLAVRLESPLSNAELGAGDFPRLNAPAFANDEDKRRLWHLIIPGEGDRTELVPAGETPRLTTMED